MNDEQQSLATQQKPAHRNNDYTNLFPGKVWPTGDVDVLERGGNLLIIKSYRWSAPIYDAHRKIFKTMVRYGSGDTAPGHITVVCVWGLGHTQREYVVFDHMGESERKATDLEGWRTWLMQWWHDNKLVR